MSSTLRLAQNPSLLLAIASDGIGPIGTSMTPRLSAHRAFEDAEVGHRVAIAAGRRVRHLYG
jgi:hypothetical protein